MGWQFGEHQASSRNNKIITTDTNKQHTDKNYLHTHLQMDTFYNSISDVQKKYWHLQYILHYTSVCGPSMLAKYLQKPGILVKSAISNIFDS